MDFDTRVKLFIYRTFADTGFAPTSHHVAKALDSSSDEVEASFVRLYKKKVLVPEPDEPSKIRMAPPFSGIKTPFPVEIGGKSYYANCVWDSLGIAAALHQDAIVNASDGYTGEPIPLEIRNAEVVPQECVIHFAVPAALWWKDIIYT